MKRKIYFPLKLYLTIFVAIWNLAKATEPTPNTPVTETTDALIVKWEEVKTDKTESKRAVNVKIKNTASDLVDVEAEVSIIGKEEGAVQSGKIRMSISSGNEIAFQFPIEESKGHSDFFGIQVPSDSVKNISKVRCVEVKIGEKTYRSPKE
jgi:hypothetical protein